MLQCITMYKKGGRGVYYNFRQSLVVPTSIQTELVPKTKILEAGVEKLKYSSTANLKNFCCVENFEKL